MDSLKVTMTCNYWLMKTEPNTFSIYDLEKAKNQISCWEGVRNYQARNFMRDKMKIGDKVFIYHSVVDPVGIVGTAKVVKEAYPDHFQFDPTSKYFDAKSDKEKPRWVMVDVQLEEIFPRTIPLKTLKACPELSNMALVQKGSRLSIQPLKEEEWDFICNMIKQI
ncbi:MAG TPA: EVE domain-containing protein [Vampirovibrionales bacterium]